MKKRKYEQFRDESTKGTKTCDPIKNTDDLKRIEEFLSRNTRNLCMWKLGINSALRVSDILKLTWEDVLEKNRKIKKELRVIEKKTGKLKVFAVNKSMKKALETWYEDAGKPDMDIYIFKSQKGKNSPLQEKNAWHVLKQIQKKVVLSEAINIGTHTMRKTFSYHAYKMGVSLETLMLLLNHSSLRATKHYIGLEKEELNEIYLNINL